MTHASTSLVFIFLLVATATSGNHGRTVQAFAPLPYATHCQQQLQRRHGTIQGRLHNLDTHHCSLVQYASVSSSMNQARTSNSRVRVLMAKHPEQRNNDKDNKAIAINDDGPNNIGEYLIPYLATTVVALVATAAFFKFVLLDY